MKQVYFDFRVMLFPHPRKCFLAGIENLRLHDLRRTLGSYEAISGASLSLDNNPVRAAIQKATDKMVNFIEPVHFRKCSNLNKI